MYKLLILLILVLSVGCHKGYKNDFSPGAPEQVALADFALEMQTRAEKLADNYRSDSVLHEFVERAAKFHNACRRFGCGSIEGRGAFDQLYFQSGEVDRELEKSPNADFVKAWASIREDYLLQMARKLGYKPGEQ